jgi:hypothetical protein
MYFGPQLQGGRPSSKRERARESLLNWRRQHLQIYAKSQRRKQKPGQVANEPFLLLFLADALFATTLYMKSAAYCFPNFLSLPNSHELYQGARNDCATAPPQPPPNPTVQLKKKNQERLLPFSCMCSSAGAARCKRLPRIFNQAHTYCCYSSIPPTSSPDWMGWPTIQWHV